MQKGLPVKYRMEIYFNSLWRDPEATYESSTPFLTMGVGDLYDLRSIHSYEPSEYFHIGKVKEIIHYVYEIENSHIGHGIGVCIELRKHEEKE
jgi:hypothetical protein